MLVRQHPGRCSMQSAASSRHYCLYMCSHIALILIPAAGERRPVFEVRVVEDCLPCVWTWTWPVDAGGMSQPGQDARAGLKAEAQVEGSPLVAAEISIS